MKAQMKNKDNRFIYALKFIACLFVITIHARIPGMVGDLVMSMARFAVPFFFAVSGRFLLTTSDGGIITEVPEIRSKVSGSLKKLLKITGIVYLIHLIFSFTVNMISGTPAGEYFSSKFNLFELRNFILFNSGKFIYDASYTFDHMWYLFALIYVYALIYIFAPVMRKWYKGLIAILLFFLYFGELLQTYYPIRPFDISISTWYVMRNWLFVGIPFVLLGILFADRAYDVKQKGDDYAKEYFARLKMPAIIGVVAGAALSFIEMNVIDSKEVYFGTLFIVVGLLVLSECVNYEGEVLSILGKRASSNFYFYHVLVIAFLELLSHGTIGYTEQGMLLKTILVMVICFLMFGLWPLYKELGKSKVK